MIRDLKGLENKAGGRGLFQCTILATRLERLCKTTKIPSRYSIPGQDSNWAPSGATANLLYLVLCLV